MAAERDRDAAHRAVICLLERELGLRLDVPPLLAARGPCAAAPFAPSRSAAAEEGPEEVRERILAAAPEHVPHLFFGHRPGAAGTAHVDRPGATFATEAAPAEPRPAGIRLSGLLRLLILPPVRPEPVVLLPLLRTARTPLPLLLPL